MHARSAAAWKELYDQLGVRVPVYAVFTKTDLIAGFTEFFDDLDRERRGPGLGRPSFPLNKSDAGTAALFGGRSGSPSPGCPRPSRCRCGRRCRRGGGRTASSPSPRSSRRSPAGGAAPRGTRARRASTRAARGGSARRAPAGGRSGTCRRSRSATVGAGRGTRRRASPATARWIAGTFVKKRWPPRSNRWPLCCTVRAMPPTWVSASNTAPDAARSPRRARR